MGRKNRAPLPGGAQIIHGLRVEPGGIIERSALRSGGIVEDLVIPEGVREIDEMAFASFGQLRSVTFPTTLTRICAKAFRNCGSLKKIVFSEGLRNLGVSAFEGCISLEEVHLPKSLEWIGEMAFSGCKSLKKVEVEGDPEIGENAFMNCRLLANRAGMLIIKDQLCGYTGDAESVVVPNGVRVIGPGVFRSRQNLIRVSLPDSVEIIREDAFALAGSLTRVRLGTGLQEIHNSAFECCSALERIVLPYGLRRIGKNAFRECERLPEICIPDTVELIDALAFMCCKALKRVVLPKTLRCIKTQAFQLCDGLQDERGLLILNNVLWSVGSNQKVLEIPAGVERIERWALMGQTQLEEVRIPESVREICSGAFAGCTGLREVLLPPGVKILGSRVFSRCESLRRVTLGEGTEKVGCYLFEGCDALEEVVLPASLKRVNPMAFGVEDWIIGKMRGSKQRKIIPSAPAVRVPDLTQLPRDLRCLGAVGFAEEADHGSEERSKMFRKYIRRNAGKLTEIALRHPALLDLLFRERWFDPLSMEKALEYARERQDVELTAKLLNYRGNLMPERQWNAEDKREAAMEQREICRRMELQGKQGLEGLHVYFSTQGMRHNRHTLQLLAKHKGMRIEKQLNCRVDMVVQGTPDALWELFPEDAEGEQAGRWAEEHGAELISEEDFLNRAMKDAPHCFDVHDGHLRDYLGPGGRVEVPEGVVWIGACFRRNLDITEICMPDSVQELYAAAFEGCTGLRKAVLSENLDKIPNHCFSNCRNLEQIRLPKGLREIGDLAFEGCDRLETLELPENLQTIGTRAFSDSDGLKQIRIPDSVTQLGQGAFRYCFSLEWAEIGSGVQVLDETFDGCGRFREVQLHEGLKIVGPRSFSETILRELKLPESVTEIEEGALNGCRCLEVLEIPPTVRSISPDLFRDVFGLETRPPVRFRGAPGSPAQEIAQNGGFAWEPK